MKLKVGIEPDAIARISKAGADKALEELIWNAIDGEANNIDVVMKRNSAKGIESIIIEDDGHGIDYDLARSVFSSIGGSPKRHRRSSPNLERPYHGEEGQGRYKVFGIGGVAIWHSRYMSKGRLQHFSVRMTSSKLDEAELTDIQECDGKSGCAVEIRNLGDGVTSLDNLAKIDGIAAKLAPTLIANPAIKIRIDGELIDLKSAIKNDTTINVESKEDSTPLLFKLRILEWKKPRRQTCFWCDETGMALDETKLKIADARSPLTAYIIAPFVRVLHESNELAKGELSSEVRRVVELTASHISDYVREREAQNAAGLVKRLREEGIYPYRESPKSPIEKAEQEVFDICTAKVHQHLPRFEKADKESRELTYRLIKESLEQNPTNLTKIIQEVLKLSGEEQQDFADLLQKTSLSSIIESANLVKERLLFLNGLEQIVHKKSVQQHVKERTQLQRILVEELWLFGDEYTLGGDDVSLRTIVNDHRKILGLPAIAPKALKAIKGLSDIPDLLLWRQYIRGQKDQFENLVIELKRPSVKLSLKEISQINRYAAKVINESSFDKENTRWTFYVISDEVAEEAEGLVNPSDRKPGHIHRGNNYDIWAITWSQIIHRAKVKLLWIQEKLALEVTENDEGLEYLQERYNEKLPAVARKKEESSEVDSDTDAA